VLYSGDSVGDEMAREVIDPDVVVTGVEVDYMELYQRAGGNPDEPYVVYEFANGRKRFMSNFQGEGIYDKPFDIVDGEIVHLPDPDVSNNTNP
jgi:hypothetical protein